MYEESPNYVDMPLDEVIRDMKARQTLMQGQGEDNSPMLFQSKGPNFNQRKPPYFKKQFKSFNRSGGPKGYGNRNRSNYFNHLARKRVKAAHNTLDLRRKLIRLRATREGLDLRWQLVANMIAKMRQQAAQSRGPTQQRFHPYTAFNRLPGAGPAGGTMASNMRVSRPMMNKLERLVGKLPHWFMPGRAVPAQPAHVPQQHHHHHHPVDPALYCQRRPSAPSHCGSHHSCCASVCGDTNEMPPLTYAPPSYPAHQHHQQHPAYSSLPPPLEYQAPPSAPRHSTDLSQSYNNMRSFDDSGAEFVEVIHVDEETEARMALQPKKTLHERFTGL